MALKKTVLIFDCGFYVGAFDIFVIKAGTTQKIKVWTGPPDAQRLAEVVTNAIKD